jgi:hypothetical protein
VAQGSIVGPDSPVPADPKLKLGSVDTSADTVEQVNRQPDLVVQSLQSGNINNVTYPEEFGAVGDGSTDDFQALQDALLNASTVRLRADTTYLAEFPQTLSIPSDTALIGPPSATLLWDFSANFSGNSSNRIFIENANPVSGGNQNIRIGGGFVIDGGTQSSPNFTSGGMLNLHNVSDSIVHGLELRNGPKHNFEISHGDTISVSNITSVRAFADDELSISDGAATFYGSSGDSVSESIFISNVEAGQTQSSNAANVEVDDGPKSVFLSNVDVDDGLSIATGRSGDPQTPPEFVSVRDSNVGELRLAAKANGGYDHVKFVDCRIENFIQGTDNNNKDNLTEFRGCTFDATGGSQPYRLRRGTVLLDNCRFTGFDTTPPNQAWNVHPGTFTVTFKDCVWDGQGINSAVQFDQSTGTYRFIRPTATDISTSFIGLFAGSGDTIDGIEIVEPDIPPTERLIFAGSGVDGDVLDLSIQDFEEDYTDIRNRVKSGVRRFRKNGLGIESAAANQPQKNWETGARVDFTDTSGGSGSGVYLIDQDGNPVKID